MNWLDVLMAVLAAIFVLQGVRQGFTRLAIGLGATLLGIILASWMYGTAGAFLIPYVSSRSLANIAGFLIVFIAVQLAGALLARDWAGCTNGRADGAGSHGRGLRSGEGGAGGHVIVMILTAFPSTPCLTPSRIPSPRRT